MKPVLERVFNDVRCPVRERFYDQILPLKQTDWSQALDIVKYKVQDQVIDWNLVWNKVR